MEEKDYCKAEVAQRIINRKDEIIADNGFKEKWILDQGGFLDVLEPGMKKKYDEVMQSLARMMNCASLLLGNVPSGNLAKLAQHDASDLIGMLIAQDESEISEIENIIKNDDGKDKDAPARLAFRKEEIVRRVARHKVALDDVAAMKL